MSKYQIVNLELQNFKSYKGNHIIGEFRSFHAIIGPNGSGKSNLMDAISFVLGVNSAQLRGVSLRDLVHRDKNSRQSATSELSKCFVKLILQKLSENDEEGETIEFMRQIVKGGQASEYSISKKVVSKEDYENRLLEFGINITARNFLVFQGDLDSVVKDSFAITRLIERISGSDQYKEEYDNLLSEKEKIETSTTDTYEEKKKRTNEKNEYKKQKEEVETYDELATERDNVEQKYYLWQLNHIEKDIKKTNQESSEIFNKVEDIKEKEAVTNEQLNEKKKEHAKIHKEVLTLDRKIKQKSREEEQNNKIKLEADLKLYNDYKKESSIAIDSN